MHSASLVVNILIVSTASTVAENGRKTCLRLKVFVRPASKFYEFLVGFI